jgi:MarR family transcriptional regulator, organic hydroperoxide resistance regulator
MYTMQQGLGTLLRQLLDMLDGDAQALYSSMGEQFRPRFFPVVQELLSRDGLAVTELASRAAVTQPAMTQTLREMVSAGLVELHSADKDGRQRLARLTDEGRAAAKRLMPLWVAVADAATTLDAELPVPLRDELRSAIAALEAKSFSDRIQEKLS